MPFNDIPLPIIAFVPVFFAVALIETILSRRWVPLYMRTGIPVWQQTKPILKDQFEKATTQMDGAEMRDKSYFTIVFKQISPYEVAFQNKSGEINIGFRRRMTIRGIVKLDKGQKAVKVVTFFPWIILVALIFALGVFMPYFLQGIESSYFRTFPIFFLPVLALIFGWQLVSLQKINKRILERFIEDY